ncbi:hypothetical protein Tco_1362350 [Tanacetum coccineum]
MNEQTKKFRWSFHKSILDHSCAYLFSILLSFADVAHNLEILHDKQKPVTACSNVQSLRLDNNRHGHTADLDNNKNSSNGRDRGKESVDSQQSRVFPESCTILFMPNVVVETQESVVMLPEIDYKRSQDWPTRKIGKSCVPTEGSVWVGEKLLMVSHGWPYLDKNLRETDEKMYGSEELRERSLKNISDSELQGYSAEDRAILHGTPSVMFR